MQTILEASGVTAAAAGRLSVGPKDAESARGWLAIARIVRFEVWVEAGAGSETGQPSLDLANQTKIDGRILALAAIPRGGKLIRYLRDYVRRMHNAVFRHWRVLSSNSARRQHSHSLIIVVEHELAVVVVAARRGGLTSLLVARLL